MQSHVISEKTKSHLVVHEALVVVSWEKSSEVSAMFVNLARNAGGRCIIASAEDKSLEDGSGDILPQKS